MTSRSLSNTSRRFPNLITNKTTTAAVVKFGFSPPEFPGKL